MTPTDIAAIRESWAALAALGGDRVAGAFYRLLFERHPSLRPMFPTDMTGQNAKVAGVLGYVVAELERPGSLIPAVEALGRRHAGYGVEDAHYDWVGGVLLETFETLLGPARFGAEERAAWAAAYGVLSGVMKGAAVAKAA